MSTELQVPEHLRTQATRSIDVDSAAASSMSVPRLSIRGKVFRYIENGEEVVKDKDTTRVIILGVEPGPGKMMKSYYEKGYVPGASDPPDCASHDGIAPSPWVAKPQNRNCMECKWNAFGSATSPNGKPTKKCRDSKQAWVIRADDPKGVEGVQYALNISVASLRAFSEHGRKLAGHNLGFHVVITKLTMADSEFPELLFEVDGFTDPAQTAITTKLNAERPWSLKLSSIALAAPAEAGLALPNANPLANIPEHLKAGGVQASQPAQLKPATPIDNVLSTW